jgi:hypothetical protein
MRFARPILASLMLGAAAALVVAQPTTAEQAMARAARALLATLDEAQRQKIQFPFGSEERFNWYYVPRPQRLGLPLKQMTEAQRAAAFALLRAGLSEKGYTKAETIRSLEHVLFAASRSATRDAEMYFFTIFGDPGQPTWGWRYEGHHVSQNWTIAAGKAIATSPAFLGANPAEVQSEAPNGPAKGTRALGAEEDLARALLEALTPDQRREAIVGATAPNEIFTTNSRKASRLEHGGILASTLTREQQGLLMTLIEEHARVQAPGLAERRLARVKADGLGAIRFAWLGAPERGRAHYYSIQGTSFLVEYDNTQNNANHHHIVWRDFAGDFGVDVLATHYATDPHHRATRPPSR